jgi:hypothetical protein
MVAFALKQVVGEMPVPLALHPQPRSLSASILFDKFDGIRHLGEAWIR